MKTIENRPFRLVMRDRDLFMIIWPIAMPLFAAFALSVVLQQYNPSLKPAVFICGVFIIVGLFALFFMQKKLTFVFDKKEDKATIYYPKLFATKHETETFPVSDLTCIAKKFALGYSSGDSHSGSYVASGFDFVLESGKRIHGGIYSSSHKKINKIINHITKFIEIPVLEEKADDEVEILHG